MRSAPQRGMTMIELLVAMAIGVTVTLAVSTLLVASENQKRITTSTNDADQTLVYTFSELDRALRGAGSGIAQSQYGGSQGILGCRLNMSSNGVVYMPRPRAYPAPFSTRFLGGGASPTPLRMAPVLIGAGQSDNANSDVIVVMGGSGSAGGVSRPVYGAGSGVNYNIQVVLQNTVGFNPYDVVLVSQNGVTDCLIEEVNVVEPTTATLTMNTTTTYYTPGTTTTLNSLASSTASLITPLGNEGTSSSPNNVQFTLYGVGTNNTLYSYDLMQYASLAAFSLGGDTTQPIADQVIQMNALYGVAAANSAVVANWAGPGTTPGYDINTVMNNPGTQTSIVAVRVAIVVRGEYYDKKIVSPTSLTIFSNLVDAYGNSLTNTVPPPGQGSLDQHYRYRVYEFTVPLRNMIVLAGGP